MSVSVRSCQLYRDGGSYGATVHKDNREAFLLLRVEPWDIPGAVSYGRMCSSSSGDPAALVRELDAQEEFEWMNGLVRADTSRLDAESTGRLWEMLSELGRRIERDAADEARREGTARARECDGWTDPINALFAAVESGTAGDVRAAIEAGLDVNLADPRSLLGHGNTPLHIAANRGHADAVRTLLNAHAQVDATCWSGWTPLLRACDGGFPDVARLLMRAGANVNLRNDEGHSAIMRTRATNAELLRLLRDRGAES